MKCVWFQWITSQNNSLVHFDSHRITSHLSGIICILQLWQVTTRKLYTECLKKNPGVLPIHSHLLLKRKIDTFWKFSTKPVQVSVTWIPERWQHCTITSGDCTKAGVIQLYHHCRKSCSACCGIWNQSLLWLFRDILSLCIKKMLQLISVSISDITSSKQPAVYKGHSSGKTSTSQVDTECIQVALKCSPKHSGWHVSHQLQITKSMVHDAVHSRFKLHVQKLQLVQHIQLCDKPQRVDCVTLMLEQLTAVDDYLQKTILSDETIFHTHGILNCHNSRI
jgi:hypothetical protein